MFDLYGCFLKWWYPHFTPQVLIIFSRKTHGFVGETHHFRKPPKKVHVYFSLPVCCSRFAKLGEGIMFSDASADELYGIFKCLLFVLARLHLVRNFSSMLNNRIWRINRRKYSMIPSFHSINQQKPPIPPFRTPSLTFVASVSMRRSPRPFDHLLVGTLIAIG